MKLSGANLTTVVYHVGEMFYACSMSAQRITSSNRKLEGFALARERDRAALEIAEREGCSFFEAYARTLDAKNQSPQSLHIPSCASLLGC